MVEADDDRSDRCQHVIAVQRRGHRHRKSIRRSGCVELELGRQRGRGGRGVRSAVEYPLTNGRDRGRGQRRLIERHLPANDVGGARDLLIQIAVVRIPGLHAQDARLLVAGHPDDQRIAVAGVQLQSLRRARADVTLRADGREHVVLDRLEICGDAPCGAASAAAAFRGSGGLAVRIEAFPTARAARQRHAEEERRHTALVSRPQHPRRPANARNMQRE